MLKRAGYSLVIALVFAMLGFTGMLQKTAPIAQTCCFVYVGFCILSLLFSLFEEGSSPPSQKPVPIDGPQH
ncbi:MAG TPA: DUF1328 domain-containing protein [Candidatus Binatia bacterium]|nr:DUF1328 domain-containing protein [Candidatus Binatia bacterium]